MNYAMQLSLWFGLGVILEAILLVKGRFNFEKFKEFIFSLITISLILLLAVFFTSFDNRTLRFVGFESVPYELIFVYLFASSFLFAKIFKKEILPEISEKTVLIFNLLFWYVFLVYFYHSFAFLTLLFLIPTAFTFIIAFINVRLNFFWRSFFYMWFLMMIVLFVLSQFSSGNLSFFFNQKHIETLSPIDVLATGMVFLYLTLNVWYVLEAIWPFFQEGSFIRDKITGWKEYIKILSDKFSDYQLRPFHALLIILFVGSILTLNYYFKFVSDILMINALLLLTPQISRYAEK